MNHGHKVITSFLLMTPLLVHGVSAFAAQPQPANVSGPIDIQANEQEFSGDSVLAKGNVRVTYKDSVVLAPVATLIKDGGGNPQTAIFTGHPHLTQGKNRIDAEKLTFQMATSHVIAEGHAHSEVVNGDEVDSDDKPSNADKKPKNEQTAIVAAPVKHQAPDKIITDSDRQEYDRTTNNFEAYGHVRVVHGDILVKSEKLKLVYGLDGKPETAVFTGNVAATQNRNTTLADNMIYSLVTRRLQATGHVKSTVIQEKKEEPKKKKTAVGYDPLGMQTAEAAESVAAPADEDNPEDDVVIITSEAQDFSGDNGRMTAVGHVRVYDGDTMGQGPSAVLLRNSLGKAERIIFQGRSQISQPDKRWIADHIEMTVATKKVLANGNTKAFIVKPSKNTPTVTTQVAGRAPSLSYTKVEPAR